MVYSTEWNKKTFYLYQNPQNNGYYFSTSPDKTPDSGGIPLDKIPDGYEIVRRPNGTPFVLKEIKDKKTTTTIENPVTMPTTSDQPSNQQDISEALAKLSGEIASIREEVHGKNNGGPGMIQPTYMGEDSPFPIPPSPEVFITRFLKEMKFKDSFISLMASRARRRGRPPTPTELHWSLTTLDSGMSNKSAASFYVDEYQPEYEQYMATKNQPHNPPPYYQQNWENNPPYPYQQNQPQQYHPQPQYQQPQQSFYPPTYPSTNYSPPNPSLSQGLTRQELELWQKDQDIKNLQMQLANQQQSSTHQDDQHFWQQQFLALMDKVMESEKLKNQQLEAMINSSRKGVVSREEVLQMVSNDRNSMVRHIEDIIKTSLSSSNPTDFSPAQLHFLEQKEKLNLEKLKLEAKEKQWDKLGQGLMNIGPGIGEAVYRFLSQPGHPGEMVEGRESPQGQTIDLPCLQCGYMITVPKGAQRIICPKCRTKFDITPEPPTGQTLQQNIPQIQQQQVTQQPIQPQPAHINTTQQEPVELFCPICEKGPFYTNRALEGHIISEHQEPTHPIGSQEEISPPQPQIITTQPLKVESVEPPVEQSPTDEEFERNLQEIDKMQEEIIAEQKKQKQIEQPPQPPPEPTQKEPPKPKKTKPKPKKTKPKSTKK